MINTALLLLSAYTSAPTNEILSYDCRVAIFADDLPTSSFAESYFSVPVSAGRSHGGEPHVFEVGDHTVAVIADGKWRGVTWTRKNKTIANVVTAGQELIQGSAALIVQNPENNNEEVHLSCEPNSGEFPTE